MTPSGIEPATFCLVARWLNQQRRQPWSPDKLRYWLRPFPWIGFVILLEVGVSQLMV